MNVNKIALVAIFASMFLTLFSFGDVTVKTNGQAKLIKVKLMVSTNNVINAVPSKVDDGRAVVIPTIKKTSEDPAVIPLPFADRMDFDSIESKAIGRGRDIFSLDLYRPTRSVSISWVVWSDYPTTTTGPNMDEFGTGLCLTWRFGKKGK